MRWRYLWILGGLRLYTISWTILKSPTHSVHACTDGTVVSMVVFNVGSHGPTRPGSCSLFLSCIASNLNSPYPNTSGAPVVAQVNKCTCRQLVWYSYILIGVLRLFATPRASRFYRHVTFALASSYKPAMAILAGYGVIGQ